MGDEDLTRRERLASAPTMRDLAMVLFRRQKVFVLVSTLVLVVALVYIFSGNRYQSHMQILVRRGRADAPVTAQENAPVDLTRMAISEEELNSEVELLRADEGLRKVVEVNDLANHDWLHFLRRNESQEARVERAAGRLGEKLKVEPVKKTDLITISYGSEDPKVAANVLRSLAAIYLEKHVEVHRPVGELRFFEQETTESRRQLDDSEQKLRQFALQHGVVAAGQQRDLALQRLSEVDSAYRQTEIELTETQQRAQALESQIAMLPERTTTQIRNADNPELLKALKSSLLDLQLKRTQLLTKYEPGHRLVREVDQQIAQASSAITNESLTPIRDETTDRNPNYEWAKTQLQQAEVELKALRAKAEATRTQVLEYRTIAQRFGEDAVTQDDLLSTEKAAQENHLLYVKKQEEARLDDALDQRGIVNVAIAEPPVAPALPVWSSGMVLIASVFVAGTAGLGAAFATEHLDPAFHAPDEVLLYLEAPVLASLPRKAS